MVMMIMKGTTNDSDNEDNLGRDNYHSRDNLGDNLGRDDMVIIIAGIISVADIYIYIYIYTERERDTYIYIYIYIYSRDNLGGGAARRTARTRKI